MSDLYWMIRLRAVVPWTIWITYLKESIILGDIVRVLQLDSIKVLFDYGEDIYNRFDVMFFFFIILKIFEDWMTINFF